MPRARSSNAAKQAPYKSSALAGVSPRLKIQVPAKGPIRSPSNASQRAKISIVTVPPKSPTSSQPSSPQPSPRVVSCPQDLSTSPHRQYASMALLPTFPVPEDSDESGSPVSAGDPEYDWHECADLDSPLENLGSPISDRYAPFDCPLDEPDTPISPVEKYQRSPEETLPCASFRSSPHPCTGTPRTGMI